MRVAAPVTLTPDQKQQLSCAAASKTASVRFALRARMILLAADGLQDKQIAAKVEMRRQAVSLWRKRFLALGVGGLAKGELKVRVTFSSSLEKYNKRGVRLGEFDAQTGGRTKAADPTRRIEP